MTYSTSPESTIIKQRLKIKLSVCMLCLLPLLGFAGNQDTKVDMVAPNINLQSPGTHFDVLRGENIHMNAHLQDNQELDSYRIVITKGGVNSDKYTDSFSSYFKLDANGKALPTILGMKTYNLNFNIKVDDKAVVGDYNLYLYLKDRAGNESRIERFFNVRQH